MPRRTLKTQGAGAEATQVLEQLEDWIKGLVPVVHGADEALVQFYLLRDRVHRAERAAEIMQRSQAEATALLSIWK